MKEIGGFFPYEPKTKTENNYIHRMFPQAKDVKHMMSGRCAIYLCLMDSLLTDKKRVAYLPAYTCETVIGCFIKAGYDIYYYDVDKNLTPLFDNHLIDKISFLLICGYYGFSTFDIDFVKRCQEQGVTVLQDTTHTAFSMNHTYLNSDYVAVSLRKWMGVKSGGLAVKRNGRFQISLLPSDKQHLKIRDQALKSREIYELTEKNEFKNEGYDAFWEAEWMLRKIFDLQEGDKESLKDIQYYPLDEAIEKRRENYAYLLKYLPKKPGITPMFQTLSEDDCPMFFPFLCDDRKSFMEYLDENDIAPKVYWPVPPCIDIEKYPHAQYIYSHIMSISCDQRYTIEDMKRVVDVISDYRIYK